MKKRVLACALAVALPLGGCHMPWSGGQGHDGVVLSGTVEAREVALSFQVKGRITRLATDEGRAIAVGDAVARLDPTDYRNALAQSAAQRDASHAALAELLAGTRRQELEAARATLKRAAAQRVYGAAELRRVTRLAARHLASQDQLDQARLALSVAQAAEEEARQQLDLLEEGPRKEQIDQARAQYTAAQAAVATAQQNLDYTALASPVAGVVSARLAEAGEVVGAAQSIFKVQELAHPWVRAYLPEPDLSRVKLGQAAQVRVDGLPGKVFTGRLSFISPEAEFTPKTVQTQALRVDLVYRVKIDVANPDGLLKVGMPADVVFQPGP